MTWPRRQRQGETDRGGGPDPEPAPRGPEPREGHLEGKDGLATLQRAPRDGPAGALSEATELDDPLVDADGPPGVVVQVFDVQRPALLEAELFQIR